MTELLYKYDQLYEETRVFIEETTGTGRFPYDLFNELRPQLLLQWNKPNPAHRYYIKVNILHVICGVGRSCWSYINPQTLLFILGHK